MNQKHHLLLYTVFDSYVKAQCAWLRKLRAPLLLLVILLLIVAFNSTDRQGWCQKECNLKRFLKRPAIDTLKDTRSIMSTRGQAKTWIDC